MKLRQLQFAIAIAETGSFSQAAEVCNATQPTLSNALSQLEEEFGGKLFTRTTRKVKLTPFGTYLLPYLRGTLDARDELEKAAETYHNPAHKILCIGFSPLVDIRLLDSVLEPFRRDNPEVSIFFKECMLSDLEGRLSDGSVDIAIVPGDTLSEHHDHLPFYSDALYYIPQDGVETVLASPLELARLPLSPIIMTNGGCGLNRSLELLFAREGAEIVRYPGQAISYQVIMDWAGLGIGAGVLPKAKLGSARNNAVPLMLSGGEIAQFNFEWMWSTDISERPHFTALMHHIRSRVPNLVQGVNLDTVRHR